jgi:hypothetical protein
MTYKAKFEQVSSPAADHLIAGNAHLLVGRKVTLAGGQGVLPRGTVLGRITASGKYVKSTAAANDGSQVPDLILAEAVDTTDGDKQELSYARGDFNSRALTLGAGHTVAGITEALRAKGITLFDAMA